MAKTILITGATDGIGRLTAQKLAAQGHRLLLHGRNSTKLDAIAQQLTADGGNIETYVADLSRLADVRKLATAIATQHSALDVLINNAGVFNTPNPITADGLDVRFVVNAIAPYLLTQRLLPLMDPTGRVVNIASAGQAPVDLQALRGDRRISKDFDAYAQSKLAIIMWSRHLAQSLGNVGPVIIAVNPGSLLGSKMVKEAFGMAGKDLNIGADILIRAALSDEFATASGQYFDNDSGQFAAPHQDALDPQQVEDVMEAIATVIG
ncbi:MAG: SDR family NAD(P)-dependent oxidoreductase [Cyanobacteria bacterium P01_H01_bin.130]